MAVLKFKTIKLGDKGPQVKKAQELLKKHGSFLKVTGEFSIGMFSAVRSFQKKNGLPVTGKIDRKTWDKLNTRKTCKK